MRRKVFESTFGLITALSFFLVLVVLLGLLAHLAPRAAISLEVQHALQNGEIQVPGRWVDPTDFRGIDAFTDCMALQIATDAPANFKDDLLDSRIYQLAATSTQYPHACDTLATRNFGLNDGSEQETRSYGRYWWGSATLARIALGWGGISVNAYRSLVFVCVIASLSAYTLGLARRAPNAILPLAPYVFAYIFGFNLMTMGQSISQAPEEVIGASIVACLLLFRANEKPLWIRAALYGLLGMICIYLDLLNGVIILILSLVLVASSAEIYESAGESATPFHAAALAAVKAISPIFFIIAGAIISLMVRIEGQALVNHITFLAQYGIWHASLQNRVDGALSEIGQFNNHPTLRRALGSLKAARTIPFYGILPKHVADVFYIVGFLGWLVGIWFGLRNLRRQNDSRRIVRSLGVSIVLIICGLMPPAWYLVFLQHTIIHSWMTARLLSIFCGTGASYALLQRNIFRGQLKMAKQFVSTSPSLL